MKQLNLYFVLLLLLSINNYAQETEKEKTIELNNRLKFYFINGYGVIYQAPITKNTSYRLHADLNFDFKNSEVDEADRYISSRESEYATEGTEKNKAISIMISPEYCYNLINKSYVTLFVGVGPFFSYNYNYVYTESTERIVKTTDISNNSYYPNYSTEKQTVNGYNLGLICFAGVESQINDFISIFAEVDFKASRLWQDLKYEEYGSNSYRSEINYKDDTEKLWEYAFSNVKIGVSIML